jgi:hypothetical protein
MTKKYHVRERAFLNLKTDMRAYVIGVVEDTRDKLACCKEHNSGGEIQLEMADCYDDIALHFEMNTFEERKIAFTRSENWLRSLTQSKMRSRSKSNR